jgi:DNA primase
MIGLKIRDILDQQGLETKQTKRSVVASCPQSECHSDFKLYIEKNNGRSICFKCGTKWSAHGVLASLLHISIVEAENLVYGGSYSEQVASNQLNLEFTDIWTFDSVDAEFLDEENQELKEITLDPMFIPVENSETGMAYLESRGMIDLAHIRRHGILYSAVMNAVVFVVRDAAHRIVGWQARFIKPWNPKMRMMTFEGMPKAKILYNIHNANTENVILTEGPFDCLMADVPGFSSVASLGKLVSSEQIKMLQKNEFKRVYLGLDNDAFQEIQKLAEKLGVDKEVFRLVPPDHRKDLGECSQNEITEALATAERLYPDKTTRVEVYLK